MKKVILTFALLSILVFSSCKGNQGNSSDAVSGAVEGVANEIEKVGTDVATDVKDVADDLKNFVAEGTFKGVLPCADCPGIETTLVIKGDGTYTLDQTYQESADGKQPQQVGKWTMADLKLELVDDANGAKTMLEIVGLNTLTYLNEDGTKVEGELAESYKLDRELL